MKINLTEEEEIECAKTLAKVNWSLPGMESLTDYQKTALIRYIQHGDIVCSLHCLGWAFWPTENRGFYDATSLRTIATFLEIQNKPMWDEYDDYCNSQ